MASTLLLLEDLNAGLKVLHADAATSLLCLAASGDLVLEETVADLHEVYRITTIILGYTLDQLLTVRLWSSVDLSWEMVS